VDELDHDGRIGRSGLCACALGFLRGFELPSQLLQNVEAHLPRGRDLRVVGAQRFG